eukprot:7979656-Karenia_brevis.AAC.1
MPIKTLCSELPNWDFLRRLCGGSCCCQGLIAPSPIAGQPAPAYPIGPVTGMWPILAHVWLPGICIWGLLPPCYLSLCW